MERANRKTVYAMARRAVIRERVRVERKVVAVVVRLVAYVEAIVVILALYEAAVVRVVLILEGGGFVELWEVGETRFVLNGLGVEGKLEKTLREGQTRRDDLIGSAMRQPIRFRDSGFQSMAGPNSSFSSSLTLKTGNSGSYKKRIWGLGWGGVVSRFISQL
jgi:hypothetical protein